MLTNRILMFFPDNLMLNCLVHVALRVRWQHSGMCREVIWLNQRTSMSPLGAYVTIAQLTAVASLNCLTHWGKKNVSFFLPLSFPTLPNVILLLAELWVLVLQFPFWVPSPLMGQKNVLFSSLQIDHYLKTWFH